eukprot:Plantae.Rhodophyta-Rhodochaete_pulchella.ctg4513.p1 GENE.Plantae.Rhodophyta-Rhodochaete_pulchella.ctg4513~~Plantae.Rhodophyta-Rhodochaete_pulchella.ctg4513.p1  ORF type:complete len:136 (-),score=18.05 Plantae.Rhodophyta-Rhodochaete_pulchella.ctg4513:1474-1881(-)
MRKLNPAVRLVLDETTYKNTIQNRSPRSVADHLKSPTNLDELADLVRLAPSPAQASAQDEDDEEEVGGDLERRQTFREATEPMCSQSGELRKSRSVTFSTKVQVRFILKKESPNHGNSSPLVRSRKSPLLYGNRD